MVFSRRLGDHHREPALGIAFGGRLEIGLLGRRHLHPNAAGRLLVGIEHRADDQGVGLADLELFLLLGGRRTG